MPKNQSFARARNAKEDEFYTILDDIEKEMKYYRDFFKGKVVLCNCDDPYESNFFKYFAMNFNALGLKKLMATCFVDSKLMWSWLSFNQIKDGEKDRFPPDCKKRPYYIEINAVDDYDGDGKIDLLDVEFLLKNDVNSLKLLRGNGDFRSLECIEMLKNADVVVTNPPFSLFREYVAQLIQYDKKFIILGSFNNVTYKEIFPLIRKGKLWIGVNNGDMAFKVPDDYEPRKTRYWVDDTGQKWRSFGNMCWFTNVDYKKRHDILPLYKKYSPEEYPKFDNYDAINVDAVVKIPIDYDDPMGVPITFLDKFCPEQFEIIDANTIKLPGVSYKTHGLIKDKESAIDGKSTYVRIVIRRKQNES